MAGFQRLSEIIENGYCLSCGLCVGLVDDGALEMALTVQGQLRPRSKRELTEAEDERIVRMCPGVSLSGPFDGTLSAPDPIWGEALRVAEGWAADADLRYRASAGGVMTAINIHLLESGQADFILQVEPGGPDALSSRPVMIRDPADLMPGAQSRYAPCAPLTALQDALSTGERFAVSLKPCDVAGVRNLQREDVRARDQIVFTMAMFCGTVPSRETSLDFLRRRRVEPEVDRVAAMRWRGNGCPGPTVATMSDGRELSGTYNEMWVENDWTTQFRCKICPDAVGLHADLATGDFWDDAAPIGESPGENGIIAHTSAALAVLDACEAQGRLVLRDVPVEDLSRTQPHHVRLRQTHTTRVAAAAVGGLPMPEFSNLAGAEAATRVDAAELAETFQGTVQRVRAGNADECKSVID